MLLLLPFIVCNAQVVRQDYDFIGKPGSHGPPWILVEKNKKMGFIDKDWKLVVPVEYDQIEPFEFITYHSFPENSKWYPLKGRVSITINGERIVPANWDNKDLKEIIKYTYAIVSKGNKFGAIDTTGKLIIPVVYDSIGRPGGFSDRKSVV